MVPDFIPAGCVREVGFEEVAGLHNRFTFKYRPYKGTESDEAYNRLAAANGQATQIMLANLRERLMGWSFERPITLENLSDLSSPIFNKISNVILGLRGPDFEVQENGENG